MLTNKIRQDVSKTWFDVSQSYFL